MQKIVIIENGKYFLNKKSATTMLIIGRIRFARLCKRSVLLASLTCAAVFSFSQLPYFTIPKEQILNHRIRAIKQCSSVLKSHETIYTYNDSGMLEQEVYLIDHVPNIYTFYKYDSSGKYLLQSTRRIANKDLMGVMVDGFLNKVEEINCYYSYDSSTHLLTSIYKKSGNKIYQIDSIRYHPKSIRETRFDKAGNVSWVYDYFFDDKENIESLRFEKPGNHTVSISTYKNKYDKENRIMASSFNNGSGPVKIAYSYYDNGLLRSKISGKYFESFTLTYKVY